MWTQFVTKNPSRTFKNLFPGISKMVNICSLYAPLINRLKLARLISAGFHRASAAAPTSTNTTFLWKECISHIHQHPPRLIHPGFPWRCFPAVDLCFRQIPLLEIPSALRSPSSLKISTVMCSVGTADQPLQTEAAANPYHVAIVSRSRCHMESAIN